MAVFVKLTSAAGIGGQVAEADEIVEVSESEARTLLKIGRGVVVDAKGNPIAPAPKRLPGLAPKPARKRGGE